MGCTVFRPIRVMSYAMDDAGRMQMLDAAQHLVQQIRHALVVEIHLDDLAQVGVHQLHHQIDVLEVLQRALRRERVQQADDLNRRCF